MSTNQNLVKLKRKLLLVKATSAMLATWGMLWIWLTWTYYEADKIFFAAGIIFLLVGLFGLFHTAKWSGRAIWVYQHVIPQPMNLRLEITSWTDSTDFAAYLSPASNDYSSQIFKVPIAHPSWNVELLDNKVIPARVFIDPNTGKVAVIETNYGLLWNWGFAGDPVRNEPTSTGPNNTPGRLHQP